MENCFACHGPDSATRKADLRLDKREVAIELGAITPGDLDASELIQRLITDDPELQMPPKSSEKTLTAEQKDILSRWVKSGAEYQPLWSFIPPNRGELPAVKNEGWVRTPIDRFILAKLEANGLTPAPEADRRILARRLSLDLTGLPPSIAEVEQFVADESPDYYEKYVDRLLDSPRWGEHRGRYWLDVARYADTHGIHFDNYREVWSYRDWVIDAFNRNMPFDRFTVEQLAGDLLPDRTLDQQIASGFNRCNITTNEGGAINEEYLVLYARDRTETTAQTWLGLTAGCAVCHDHKFDPLSQKEFYAMSAFFNNTVQGAMDGNIKDTPPAVFVPPDEDRDRWNVLTAELADTKAKLDARKTEARPDYEAWLAGAALETVKAQIPADSLKFHVPLDEGKDTEIHWTVDGQGGSQTLPSLSWEPGHIAPQAYKSSAGNVVENPAAGDFEKDQPFSFGAWIKLPKPGATGSAFARMDDGHDFRGWDLWIENGRPGTHIINKWPDDALKVVSNTEIKPGEWTHVFMTYDGTAKGAGVKIYINGQAQPTSVPTDALKNTIKTTVPFKLAQRDTTSRINDLALQDLRVYGRALPSGEVATLKAATRAASLVAKPADQRTQAENDELFAGWIGTQDGPTKELSAKVASIEAEQGAIKAKGTVAHVMQEKGDAAMAYILFRGDYDKRRDEVKAETPAFLPPMSPDLPKNRLGFAKWLLTPEHPLTARVTVNRFWQQLFGTGIVRTSGDFGVTGETPSDQELLDWMAVEFRENGWNVKEFFKLLVTSAAYRQSAVTTPEKLEKDEANRLVSRGPRFRMDAEMVRDYALAASGLLVSKVGGPSVRPYQPDGVWEAVAMIGSNTRDYKADTGDGLYRRSLYTFWKRAAPPASMDIFNAPSRETCTVRRERTNTPLQALVTLNDPQFIEAARYMSQSILKNGGSTPEERIDSLALRVLARRLRPEEMAIVKSSLDDLLAFYNSHEKEAAELLNVGEFKAEPGMESATLAAWTMLANEVLNLDEALNK
jgi:hypothetical protein